MRRLSFLFLLFTYISNAQHSDTHFQNDADFRISDAINLYDDVPLFSVGSAYYNDFDSSAAIAVTKNNQAFHYQTYSRDEFNCVRLLADENLLIGGIARQEGEENIGPSLLKVNDTGELIWHKIYQGDFLESIIDVFELEDGNILSIVRGTAFDQPSKVLITDAQGNFISQYGIISGSISMQLTDVVTEGGVFYGAGSVFNLDLGRNLAFIVAFDSEGLIWDKLHDVGRSFVVNALAKGENGFIIGGTVPDPESVLFGTNAALIHVEDDGEALWGNEIFREGVNMSESITSLRNGEDIGLPSIYAALSLEMEDGISPTVMRFQEEGFINSFFESDDDFGGTLNFTEAVLDWSGMLLVGHTDSGDGRRTTIFFDSFPCIPQEAEGLEFEELIVSTDEIVLGTVDYTPQVFTPETQVIPWEVTTEIICDAAVEGTNNIVAPSFNLFPNPSSGLITLDELSESGVLTIRNSVGKQILEKSLFHQKERIDLRFLPAGVYFLTIQFEDRLEAARFIRQ